MTRNPTPVTHEEREHEDDRRCIPEAVPRRSSASTAGLSAEARNDRDQDPREDVPREVAEHEHDTDEDRETEHGEDG